MNQQERKATSAAELQNKKSRYSLKYRPKTQKDYKSLHKTKEDFASLQTLLKDSKRLQESWQTAIQ